MDSCKIIEKIEKEKYSLIIKDRFTLEFIKIDDNLYIFEKFISPVDLTKTEYNLIKNKIKNFSIKNSFDIMIDETKDNIEKIAFLENNSFDIKYIKYLYEKNLKNHIEIKNHPFKFSSLEEVGEEEFMEIFNEVLIDDLERDCDTKTYFQKMKDSCGDFYFPKDWIIVKLNSKKIGIVLAQLYPNNPKNGGLSYIGFNKENRNKGYGKILHSIGISLLKEIGAKKYIGSTTSLNLAMQKIFEFNNCELSIKRFFYST